MALVAFPRIVPESITAIPNTPGFAALRNPDAGGTPVQIIGRGVMYWSGTVTWPYQVAALEDEHDADELVAFLVRIEGGLHTFEVPLYEMQNYKEPRFASHDETTNSNSVQVTARTPATDVDGAIGYASELTLNTSAAVATQTTPAVGLRQGDWISLHSGDMSEHYGAYLCAGHQVGDKVTVGPAVPAFPTGVTSYRVNTLKPTIRARLSGGVPAISRTGFNLDPITISWIQS